MWPGRSWPGLRWERRCPSRPEPKPPETEQCLAGPGLLCAGFPPASTMAAPRPRVSPSPGCFSGPGLWDGHNWTVSFKSEVRITEGEASPPWLHDFRATAFWKSPVSGDGKTKAVRGWQGPWWTGGAQRTSKAGNCSELYNDGCVSPHTCADPHAAPHRE